MTPEKTLAIVEAMLRENTPQGMKFKDTWHGYWLMPELRRRVSELTKEK